MTIETATYVADLDPVQPPDSDLVAEGDDHLRLIKNVLLATFPGRGLADTEVLNKTANFTAGLAEVSAIYNVTVASTAALPALSGLAPGTYYFVWANGVAVTVDPSGTELVNGATTLSLAADTGCLLAPTGGEWLAMVFGIGAGGGGGGGLAYGPTNNSWGGENTINPGGSDNTAIGANVLVLSSGGIENTGLGSGSLAAITTGSSNTALGVSSLATADTGGNNVAVGFQAARDLTSGTENIALGSQALLVETSGARNIAIGAEAMVGASGASSQIALGYRALYSSQATTQNIGIGNNVGQSLTTGNYNIGLGFGALAGDTTGVDNIAIGRSALNATTGAQNQIAIGTQALQNAVNVSLQPNVAIGYQAGRNVSSGGANVCIGAQAGLTVTTGDYNTIIGWFADADANGLENTLIGHSTRGGSGNSTTAIGANACANITTGTKNTALGSGALTGLATYDNCTGVGSLSVVTGSNQVQLGDSFTTTYAYGAVQARSDARDKADIRNTKLGLDFILSLRPVEFRWDYREDYTNRISDGSKKRSRLHQGLIAQEVQDVVDASGLDFAGLQHHQIAGGEDVYSIGYSELITPLIKALQELTEEFRAYKEAHP